MERREIKTEKEREKRKTERKTKNIVTAKGEEKERSKVEAEDGDEEFAQG